MKKVAASREGASRRRAARAEPDAPLPPPLAAFFRVRGWSLRPHQAGVLREARAGRSVLLVAPTGGGKTLGGFLPSLVALAAPRPESARGLHTLYVSPLKALAADIERNLAVPIAEAGIAARLALRTGDTPPAERQRQMRTPPDILLTTPEQLALLIASEGAERVLASLEAVVIDELHALAGTKRGELLALGLARLSRLAPGARRLGLSATVKHPDALRAYLVPQREGSLALASLVEGRPGAPPDVEVLASREIIPWSGHTARHAMAEVYERIEAASLTLVFVNTRSQAEYAFQELWRLNERALPIALHHGSLSGEQRRRVEAAMAAGSLRAVVCTSTLDLGIDWGGVDLVIHLGAPKGASRLLQRIGRANHRLDEPSRAILVPGNRFEALECEAAREAAVAGTLDGEPPRPGGLDVLAQHVLGTACAGPFDADALYAEVRTAAPYAGLARARFDRVLDFVAHGGYALKSYEQFRRIRKGPDGLYRIAHPAVKRIYRMNVGTIIEAPRIKVRLVGRAAKTGRPLARGGRVLGEVEEYLVETLRLGDTFLFAGHILRFEGLRETEAIVTRANASEPMVPSWIGGKFPLSTFLAERVREIIHDEAAWPRLPAQIAEWLAIQKTRSRLPGPDDLLVETFARGERFHLVTYPFEGRLAHQTLGMLLTRRLERLGAHPLGFVANDYSLAVWALEDMGRLDLEALFEEDMLGDDLEAWLAESALLKRTFRQCAVIAGLIERRFPGAEKSGRQVTFSSDLIYDVLRRHEPGHILLEAAYEDASRGLLDIARLGMLLKRVKGRIVHQRLARVSPMAVTALLEIGRVPVHGAAGEALLREASEDLIAEATGGG
ncbi:MAG: ligase-associated DNA damage response DEXH box helicase [Alphaproteobacteria bacterium]|nr:ligase-associated DNA damage response DEXH box helicase [Alphaproteobacteria bacterium]